MSLLRPESSRVQVRARAPRRLRAALVLALIGSIATAGCGGATDNPATQAGAAPDVQAKSSRDYSRAQYQDKAKGRSGSRR